MIDDDPPLNPDIPISTVKMDDGSSLIVTAEQRRFGLAILTQRVDAKHDSKTGKWHWIDKGTDQ